MKPMQKEIPDKFEHPYTNHFMEIKGADKDSLNFKYIYLLLVFTTTSVHSILSFDY